MSKTPQVNLKLLPGEPTDGSGRVCIHYFHECADGLISFKGHAQLRRALKLSEEVRGTIACRPQQNSVQPQTRNGVVYICAYSSELEAVTCPECLASPLAKTQGELVEALARKPDEEAAKVIAAAQEAHLKSLEPVA